MAYNVLSRLQMALLTEGSAAGGMFLLWECSTPFVFMRWGLHALGHGNTKLYLYNGLTMMAVFFLCRNVMGVGKPHSLPGNKCTYVKEQVCCMNQVA